MAKNASYSQVSRTPSARMKSVEEQHALVAREYLRVSHDASGRLKSPEEQHAENGPAAAEHGYRLGEPYREARAVSASRSSRKARGEFDRLIDDLRSGEFGADALQLWEPSRGSRRVSEWATLIDLLADAGAKIIVTSHGRVYDPADGRDRRLLHEDATDSEYESWKISKRVQRSMTANALAGRPHGKAPYGYRASHDSRTGGLLGWEADPVMAERVRSLYAAIKAGKSLYAIAKEWNADRQCPRTRSGREWTGANLRSMVIPAHMGKRLYKGEMVDGTWEPIVSADLYWDVRRILDDPSRVTTRHGRAVHEFSGVMRCAACGAKMNVAYRPVGSRRGKPRRPDWPHYTCARGCARIDKAEVDKLIRAAIFTYLSRAENFAELSANPGQDATMKDLTGEIARLRAELSELTATAPETIAEARHFARLEEHLTGELATKEAKLRELTTPAALLDLIAPGPDVAARWKAAPLTARRKAAALLLSPAYLGEVRVLRSTRPGQACPAEERLIWWTGDDVAVPDPHADYEQTKHRARQVYADSVRDGTPLSTRKLGEVFGYSGRWALERIREVRASGTVAVPEGPKAAARRLQQQARDAYAASVTAGAPLPHRELAARFGRSYGWASQRIREVHASGEVPVPEGRRAAGSALRQQARDAYAASARAGNPLSQRQLAARFGRSHGWAWARIQEILNSGSVPSPTPQVSTETERQLARDLYNASVQAGRPLSQRELGNRFGRSYVWARARIQETNDRNPAPAGTG